MGLQTLSCCFEASFAGRLRTPKGLSSDSVRTLVGLRGALLGPLGPRVLVRVTRAVSRPTRQSLVMRFQDNTIPRAFYWAFLHGLFSRGFSIQGGSGTELETELSEPFFLKPKAESEPPEPFSRNQNRNWTRPCLLNCTETQKSPFAE